MPPTQALFDLQGIDLELDLRDSRLEEIRRLLGDDRELRVMRHEAARLRATVKASSAAQAELDQTVAGFTSHIEQVEAKLYGGHVTLSRELQDLQADAAMIKRQRGVEEEKLLVVLVDLEQAETGLKESERRPCGRTSRMGCRPGEHDRGARSARTGGCGPPVAAREPHRQDPGA